MDFIAFHPLTSLHHIPHIDTVFQDRVYGNRAPHRIALGVGSIVFEPLLFLVGRGAKDTMIVQIIGNPALVHARQKHGKNAFDYFGGLRVNQQGVLIAGVFHISIRSIRADKLTVAALHIKHLTDFL